jgi:hypothetical protein
VLLSQNQQPVSFNNQKMPQSKHPHSQQQRIMAHSLLHLIVHLGPTWAHSGDRTLQ